MQLHPATNELVTAATNIPLAVFSLVAVVCLWRRCHAHRLRAALWIGMFGGLAIATGVGVFAHGLALDPTARKLVWQPINAALGLTVACFAAGAVLDRWGLRAAARALPVLLLLSAGFFGYATFWANSFLPFIIYEGLAMLFCLAVYVTLAIQRRLPGAGWMVAGVAITILAAGLQAGLSKELRLGVVFDRNALFHLVQLPGLFCLLIGLRIGLGPKPPQASHASGKLASLSVLAALCWLVSGCQTFNYTDEDLARERRMLAEGYANGFLCRGLGWWGNGSFGPYGGWRTQGGWSGWGGGDFSPKLGDYPWAVQAGSIYPRW
jgi:hypothetical protein